VVTVRLPGSTEATSAVFTRTCFCLRKIPRSGRATSETEIYAVATW